MDGETNYKKNTYIPNLKKGNEYEEFVGIKLKDIINIELVFFKTKKEQYNIGESLQGFEIKFDDKFIKTGNLYIEYQEKSNPNNINYINSGILREDNTWMYCVGDYNGVFLMQKSVLKAIFKNNKHKKIETTTSRGFLYKGSDAKILFKYIKF